MAKARRRQRNQLPTNPDNRDDAPGGADKTATRAWECWRAARKHTHQWREETTEAYDFVAGVQWSEDDLAKLQEEQRIAITFNRVAPTIMAVCGYEINGRQEVTYLPRNNQDTPVAEVDTAAAKYFRQQCDAEDEESDQFGDGLICGMGWTEHRMDYEENPEGMMVVERVDPLEMGWDPAAQRRNIMDARWLVRGKWWDKKTAQDKWPDHNFDQATATPNDEENLDEQPPIDRLAAAFYKSPGVGEQADLRAGKVFILEFQWHEGEPFYTMLNPLTGKTEDVEPKTHSEMQRKLEEAGLDRTPSVKREKRKFLRAFVHARDTLEEGPGPCPKMFNYQCLTGWRDRNRNVWYGMVKAMKDPQRWANKWLSQFLHMLNTNAKNGLDFEKGAFDNIGEVERKIAKPGGVFAINQGYLDKVRRVPATPIPNDAFNLMTYAIGSIKDVTGVNVELLGGQNDNQTGVVEAHRKQSALNILAPLFNSQRQYRKQAGRLTLYFIREFLSDGRMIRVASQGDAQYVPLAKRPDTAEYDLVVDQSPMAPNQKEMTFAVLGALVPQLLKMNIPVPPEIIDYAPIPSQLSEAWKKLIQQKASQPPPPDPKTQLAQAKQQTDAQESQRQDQIDMARLQFDREKLQFEKERLAFDRQKASMEAGLAGHDMLGKERMHATDVVADLAGEHLGRLHESVEAARQRAHEAEQATRTNGVSHER